MGVMENSLAQSLEGQGLWHWLSPSYVIHTPYLLPRGFCKVKRPEKTVVFRLFLSSPEGARGLSGSVVEASSWEQVVWLSPLPTDAFLVLTLTPRA